MNFSIHERGKKPVTKVRALGLLLAGGCWLAAPLFLAGCGFTQHRENSPPAAQVEPIPPDDAMQKRDWAQATAEYPNGAVAAGPTEFNYEPKRGRPEVHYYYDDTATFVVNMVLLPYNMFKHPQTEVKVTPGETVPPTYSANPVLPPPAAYQPNTTPVVENPGAEPTTPKVVEPGAMPPPEPATGTPPATPAPAETPAAPAAPAAPQPEATPAAPAAPESPAPPPAPPAAPAPPTPAPEPAPAPGETAPSTPHVIEPPPPQATKNLAPAIHPEQDAAPAPSTQPVLNK